MGVGRETTYRFAQNQVAAAAKSAALAGAIAASSAGRQLYPPLPLRLIKACLPPERQYFNFE
jgi:hypothetical protein